MASFDAVAEVPVASTLAAAQANGYNGVA